MDDDGSLSSDDILAAFRAKREGKKPETSAGERQDSQNKSGLKDIFGPPPKRVEVEEPEPPWSAPEPESEPEPEIIEDEPEEPTPAQPTAPTPEPAPARAPAAPAQRPDPPAPAPEPQPTERPAAPQDPAPPAASPPQSDPHDAPSESEGRPCGCGARGPHRAACPLAGQSVPKSSRGGRSNGIERVERTCSCGFVTDWPAAWTLHQKACDGTGVSAIESAAPSRARQDARPEAPVFPLQTVTPEQLQRRPAGQPLTAMEPVMGLADRLLEDTTLTVRGHLLGRRIGLGAGIFGLLIMILERRAVWATGDRFVLAGLGMPVLALGIVFFLLGAGAFVAFWFWPPARTLGVRLAESQAQEWEKVQEEARLWELLTWVGLGMLGGGALMAVIAYGALPDAQVVAVSSLMLVVAFAGGALLFAAFIRRQSLRRLYVQTLVLSRLEATGLGPGRMPEPIKAEPAKDRRVGPVLQALDELLGSLPDAAVNRFLSSDEAAAYLELIDEVNKSEDHDR